MRFPVEPVEARPGRRLTTLCMALLTSTTLVACSTGGSLPPSMASSPALQNGPQADYPLVIGAPYSIGQTTYRPADQLNYDEVGYATSGTGTGVTGAHHTLPLPSYVEVTSLETGRTILVRLETRGPMNSNHLVALSPRALAQLGATGETPVRVRRVNAPENQRALLRAGEEAPLRMDTPRGLVEVLRRRLPTEGSASLAGGVQPVGSQAQIPVEPAPAAVPVFAAVEPVEAPATAEISSPDPAIPPLATSALRVPTPFETAQIEPSRAAPDLPPLAIVNEQPAHEVADAALPVEAVTDTIAQPVAQGPGFVVQAGAFSVVANARRVAEQIGGVVSERGNLHIVRTGPFATRAEAEASLANVRAAGYTDARIYDGG